MFEFCNLCLGWLFSVLFCPTCAAGEQAVLSSARGQTCSQAHLVFGRRTPLVAGQRRQAALPPPLGATRVGTDSPGPSVSGGRGSGGGGAWLAGGCYNEQVKDVRARFSGAVS